MRLAAPCGEPGRGRPELRWRWKRAPGSAVTWFGTDDSTLVAELPTAAGDLVCPPVKKFLRVDARKLKVSNLDGIKLLVSTLGGVWGKAKHEEKFERFERAIYTTAQRSDETHKSYLAQHDFQFKELASLHVTLEEMRAYCLLHNSGLHLDEKKRIVMDSEGKLEYDKVWLKLLGPCFLPSFSPASVQRGPKKAYPGKGRTTSLNWGRRRFLPRPLGGRCNPVF